MRMFEDDVAIGSGMGRSIAAATAITGQNLVANGGQWATV